MAAHKHHSNHQLDGQENASHLGSDFLRRFTVVGTLLVPLGLLTKTGLSLLGLEDFLLRKYFQLAIATVIFYFSLIFFKHARHEIMMKKYGMMTLVSLAVGAGYLFSAFSTFLPFLGAEFYLEVSTLVWVLLFGHYLELRSSASAGDALEEVAKLLPKKAHLLVDGEEQNIEVSALNKGDVVVIKPGEKAPADGVIITGEANFNEALISGESKPVEKNRGERVVAGSICIDGSVQVQLDRVGENSTIGQIQNLVKEAKQTKPTAQTIADKAAKILTFTALTVAFITIVVWTLLVGKSLVFGLTSAITVLVIACPHALGLAIPTVSAIATTLAVKNGLFIKNLKKLEVVKDVDYVIFDKTGTLTKGKFGVSKVLGLEENEKQVLRIAASIEAHSSHLLGLSIVEYAKKYQVSLAKVSGFKNIAGKGIQGIIKRKQYFIGNPILMKQKGRWNDSLQEQYKNLVLEGKTAVILADSLRVLGMIVLADQIKPESRKAITLLHQLGIKTAMLTGDNKQVTKAVARELAIDTYFAEVLPGNKYKHVKELQDRGSKVMMVGDGVNDAPALSQAHIGVAVGAGTDVAVEAGDVVLTRSNPSDIVRLVILARKVYRKMVENLVWALGYNLLAIPAAAGLFIPFGFRLRPEIGALLMSFSSVIVVINAMTLRKVKLDSLH